MKNYIENMGIELEGQVPRNKFDESFSNIKQFEIPHKERIGGYVGMSANKSEYRGFEWHYFGTIKEIDSFLDVMFNNIGYQGHASCGFHVHVKLKDKQMYNYTFCKDFWTEFQKAYENKYAKNEKFLKRMTCSWSRIEYPKDKILTGGKSSAFNHYHLHDSKDDKSYNKIPTLEVRIMPYQDSKEEAMDSLVFLKKTMNRIFTKMSENPEYLREASEIKALNRFPEEVYHDTNLKVEGCKCYRCSLIH